MSNQFDIIYTNTEYLDDGSYIVYTISQENSGFIMLIDEYSKTCQKTVTKYSNNDEVLWVYVLNATFLISDGVSSSCISTTYSTTINDTSWKFSDGNSYYNGNVAYGEGVFKNKVLFVTIQTINIDISLTCDVNGNVS
jgi:hypothetical protein